MTQPRRVAAVSVAKRVAEEMGGEIGKEVGDAADIIHETQAGIVVGFKDKIKLKTELLDFYNQYKSGSLHLNSQDYLKYSRKELAFKIADVLNTLN